jgi:hypothetical protein
VVSSHIPGSGTLFMMLRLLRVLLVVKMLKGFPELQVGDWYGDWYGDWKVIGR